MGGGSPSPAATFLASGPASGSSGGFDYSQYMGGSSSGAGSSGGLRGLRGLCGGEVARGGTRRGVGRQTEQGEFVRVGRLHERIVGHLTRPRYDDSFAVFRESGVSLARKCCSGHSTD